MVSRNGFTLYTHPGLGSLVGLAGCGGACTLLVGWEVFPFIVYSLVGLLGLFAFRVLRRFRFETPDGGGPLGASKNMISRRRALVVAVCLTAVLADGRPRGPAGVAR